MNEVRSERNELNAPSGYANLAELVSRCEKIHSYTGWYCMSCDCEVDATFTEHCASCGTPLDGTNLTGNLVEAARDELNSLMHNDQGMPALRPETIMTPEPKSPPESQVEVPAGEGLASPPCSRPIGFDKPTPHAALEQVIEWLGIGYESTITRKSDGKKITIRITSEND